MLLKKEEVVKMFQNLNETEKTKEDSGNKKNILANVISKKYIILYIIILMVSYVNMGYDVSPFSLALIGAAIANEIPIIAIILLVTVGNADAMILVATGGSIISYTILIIINLVLIGVAIKLMTKNDIIKISIKKERR